MSNQLPPQDLCNDALVAYLIAFGAGTAGDTFPGLLALDKEAPITIVNTESGLEEIAFTGNYRFRVAVIVKSTIAVEEGGDPAAIVAAHKVRSGKVWEAFKAATSGHSTEICDAINTACAAASPAITFTAVEVHDRGFERDYVENLVFDTYNWELVGCPSVIS